MTKSFSLRLGDEDEAVIAGGHFARLDLPEAIPMPDGGLATTVLMGLADGELRAYANVCRHKAIPLDARGGTRLGVMTEDGTRLLCDSHGATYRPSDGRCVFGPCEGTSLHSFEVERSGDQLALIWRGDGD